MSKPELIPGLQGPHRVRGRSSPLRQPQRSLVPMSSAPPAPQKPCDSAVSHPSCPHSFRGSWWTPLYAAVMNSHPRSVLKQQELSRSRSRRPESETSESVGPRLRGGPCISFSGFWWLLWFLGLWPRRSSLHLCLHRPAFCASVCPGPPLLFLLKTPAPGCGAHASVV